MAAWTAATRRAANFARLSTPKSAATSARPPILIQRRRLAAGGAENHGAPKVNFWEDPMHPSKWKQDHFAIVSLVGCGLLFYGGYKYLTMDKKDENHEKVRGSSQ